MAKHAPFRDRSTDERIRERREREAKKEKQREDRKAKIGTVWSKGMQDERSENVQDDDTTEGSASTAQIS